MRRKEKIIKKEKVEEDETEVKKIEKEDKEK